MTKPRFISSWAGAPVGMTILLRGKGLFRRIYSGRNRIVIPAGAQRSGGTCCLRRVIGLTLSIPVADLAARTPSPLVIATGAKRSGGICSVSPGLRDSG